jgi:hypothetical protein
MAAHVNVSFNQHVKLPAEVAYRLLCDWEDHSRWVPLTKVEVHSPDSFTAYTGIGPLRLKDRMQVLSRDDEQRAVVVVKLGPVLTGSAGFKVKTYSATSCVVSWTEELHIPYLPGFTTILLRPLTRLLFRRALRRLA